MGVPNLTRLAVVLVSISLLAACSRRPTEFAAFQEPPGVSLESGSRYDGAYFGTGDPAVCDTGDGPVTYEAPRVAGFIRNDRFVGNLDGCPVKLDVYADGTVRGWTYIRTHRFIPVTYSLFDGRVGDKKILGRFDQVLQGDLSHCARGTVVLDRLDIGERLREAGATVEEAIDFYAPPTRCRTGGFQYP